jgi:hypothetical protein
MGQFKPMVKMETTEPSIELKLKSGGKVEKKMQMGGMPMGAMTGPARGGMAPTAAPKMPALAARRRAMRNMGAAQSAPVGRAATMMGMKEGGDTAQDKAMIKKAFKQHDAQEHMGGKGTKLKLKKGGMMNCATGGAIPSESTRGMPATTIVNTAKPDNAPAKTGGVRNGNAGGFKKGGKAKKMAEGGLGSSMGAGTPHFAVSSIEDDEGYRKEKEQGAKNLESLKNFFGFGKKDKKYATGGAIASEKTSGSYATTQMHTANPDNSPAKTGEVKKGNAGGFKAGGMMGGGMSGYATGGVAKANAGGYRKGGAAKKFAEGGRVQNDGGPEQMPQGRKPMSQPVAIDMFSGTYKKGGRVAPNNAKLQAINNAEFAPTMKAAKKDSNEKYGPARDFMKKAGGAC